MISHSNFLVFFMCAGFDKEKTTLDELLEYYMDHEPAVINIQMRNYVDKKDKSRAPISAKLGRQMIQKND